MTLSNLEPYLGHINLPDPCIGKRSHVLLTRGLSAEWIDRFVGYIYWTMLNIDLAIHSLLQTSQRLNELFACYYITVQYVILSYHLDLPMTASCCATARRPHEDPVLEASYDMNRAGGSRTVIASVSTQLAHGD